MNIATNYFKPSIDYQSRVPKYKQLVNCIIQKIDEGELTLGEKLPSINEMSKVTGLAKDTIVKAFTQLREKKIIIAVVSKGYYVAKNIGGRKSKVLFVLNKLSSYKLKIYNCFVDSLGPHYQVDLSVFHYDPGVLSEILIKNLEGYDYFVVMPHFNCNRGKEEAIKLLKSIPEDQLVLMDKYLPEFQGKVACVFQDFGLDIIESMEEAKEQFLKYNRLILVFPPSTVCPYPEEIKMGFLSFCSNYGVEYEIIDEVLSDRELIEKDAYMVIKENDLVNLLHQVRGKQYVQGKDIGIVSYNDTALKELMEISVLSTDFEVMAESAAYMIQKQKIETVQNYFRFIDRKSL
ncbi:GntR family transcriptional regulator [Echinicola soli]|uniref:GntR family transcriptional regulator n=1 Tax=Echinicola soli TaxID=2591634 RepID=A0A514CNK2_9BACT|nr:GntR family transcriptional regulator [Echinicola soli]QDH81294.1 GntR family transcriptional regulator [Echinicola soli]